MSVVIASPGTPPGKTQIRFAAKNVTNPEVQLALYWAAGDVSISQVQPAIPGFPTSLPESPKGPGKKKDAGTTA